MSCHLRFRRLLVGAQAIILAAVLGAAFRVQTLAVPLSGKAMSKNEVIGLLESGVDSAKVEEAAREYGISFSVTADTEGQLRDAGATDDLIKVLRSLAPKATPPSAKPLPAQPAAPPELLVEVTPGGAQVYIDDEPKGTTSQAGRLKLTQLQPGQHTVRVSLAGYRDHEQSVELTAGQISQVAATLEQIPPLAASPPAGAMSSATSPAAMTPSSEPGALGTVLAAQTPPGWRGAYIKQVAPGGPADRAGLRSGQAIISLNGQPINSPQELRDTLVRYQAGDVVRIGYTDGSGQYMTRARLARRARGELQSQSSATAVTTPAGVAGSPGVNPGGRPGQSGMQVRTFTVAHDHGSGGSDYCQGVIAVGGGMVTYRSANGIHSFNFSANEIKEARKNSVYLVALGGFHIRLQHGTNYNFVVLNAAGQFQPPDSLLSAIAREMGKN